MNNLELKMLKTNFVDLTSDEIKDIGGGGFAYDAGFFFRELWVYASNGGGVSGSAAAALDAAVYYKSLN